MQKLSVQICKSFVERTRATGMKGRARDRAALDYVCGAARTVELVGEQTNDAVTRGNMLESYRVLELLAFLASTRGYLAVEEHSKQGA